MFERGVQVILLEYDKNGILALRARKQTTLQHHRYDLQNQALAKEVMKSFSVQLSPPRQNVSTTDSVMTRVRARSTRVSGGAGQWVKFRRF